MRSQIGGDVVMLEAEDPAALAQRIQERFKIATTALDGKVRLEIKDGLKFVTAVAEAMPGTIQSVSISKPTLDDVFISRTGQILDGADKTSFHRRRGNTEKKDRERHLPLIDTDWNRDGKVESNSVTR